MKRLLLLCLVLAGCADRPRSSSDGPKWATIGAPREDLAQREVSEDDSLEDLVKEAIAIMKQQAEDLATCTQLERSHWRELQQCRKECK